MKSDDILFYDYCKTKALIKDYGSSRAVDAIDFAISKGECVGFLGPNGARKTTDVL